MNCGCSLGAIPLSPGDLPVSPRLGKQPPIMAMDPKPVKRPPARGVRQDCGTGVYARLRLQPVFGPAFMPGKPNRGDHVLFVCDVNPVYGVPAQDNRSDTEDVPEGRRPVNGPDEGKRNSTQNDCSVPQTRHECRADYRLRRSTGVNARTSRTKRKRQSVSSPESPLSRGPVPRYAVRTSWNRETPFTGSLSPRRAASRRRLGDVRRRGIIYVLTAGQTGCMLLLVNCVTGNYPITEYTWP
jgi:hypothetical protein